MICFRDMAFCSSRCGNLACRRNLTDEVREAARAWWGDMRGSPPIAISDLKDSSVCPGYEEVK